MAGHLIPGGVLVVEPWFTPEQWQVGHLHAVHYDQPDLKITRMNISERAGDLAVMEFHYLVGTGDGVEYFSERHEAALFSADAYRQAFIECDLELAHDPEGLTGRGLYIGVRSKGLQG